MKKTAAAPAKAKPKQQTNILLTENARAILKTLAQTMYPIKISEADVIETLLVEEAKRRSISTTV